MKIIFYAIILVASMIAGLWLKDYNGLIHIELKQWIIEMPLWLGIIAIVATMFLISVISDIIKTLVNLPKIIANKISKSRNNAAHKLMRQAIIKLLNNEWKETYVIAVKALNKKPDSIATHLIAAKAANKLLHFTDRDQHLAKATQLLDYKDPDVTVLIAKLYSEAGSLDSAVKLLEANKNKNSKDYYKTLAEIYETNNNWNLLRQLLPTLKKKKIFDEPDFFKIATKTYKEILQFSVLKNDYEKVYEIWKEIPKNLKIDPELAKIYIKFLIDKQEFNKAEKEIKNLLRNNFNHNILALLTNIQDNNIEKRIGFVEELLKYHPENPYILLILGKMCINAKLWGKAKTYLEASLSLKKTPEAYLELAGLANILEDNESANKYYKEGFLLTSKNQSFLKSKNYDNDKYLES